MYSAGILDASAAGRRTLAGANVEVSDGKGDSRNGHDGGEEECVYKDLGETIEEERKTRNGDNDYNDAIPMQVAVGVGCWWSS